MNLTVNGKPFTVADGSTIADVLSARSLDPAVVVVEYNKSIVARENYTLTTVCCGDEMEILRFVGGG